LPRRGVNGTEVVRKLELVVDLRRGFDADVEVPRIAAVGIVLATTDSRDFRATTLEWV
jgi:hypothetical protein